MSKFPSIESERNQPHVEYDCHFLEDYENQISHADCDSKEATEVRSERQTKVMKLPATFAKDSHVINIDRLCEMLSGWCTFDTYKFFKSQESKGSSDPCGKPFHSSCSVLSDFLTYFTYQTEMHGPSLL